MDNCIFEALVKDKNVEVRENLALNPDLPLSLLVVMVGDVKESVRDNMAGRMDLPAKIVEKLFNTTSTLGQMRIATNYKLSKKQIESILKNRDNNDQVIKGLAENGSISAENIDFIIGNTSAYLYTLNNPSISTAQIDVVLSKLLSSDPQDYDFEDVVNSNIAIPANFIQVMLKHPESAVRRVLARKKTLDTKVLQLLAQDVSADVRRAIAERHDLTSKVMLLLGNDSDSDVRYKLAKNTSVDEKVLSKLIRDPEVDVVGAAINNPTYKFKDFETKDFKKVTKSYVAHCMASNPSLPIEFAPKLLKAATDYHAAANLAINPSIGQDLLDEFLTHESSRVRYALTMNPNTPAHALVSLASDIDSGVRSNVVLNPALPTDSLDILSSDESWQVRQSVASVCSKRGLSKNLILKLTKDKNKEVRITLANPKYKSHFEHEGMFT